MASRRGTTCVTRCPASGRSRAAARTRAARRADAGGRAAGGGPPARRSPAHDPGLRGRCRAVQRADDAPRGSRRSRWWPNPTGGGARARGGILQSRGGRRCARRRLAGMASKEQVEHDVLQLRASASSCACSSRPASRRCCATCRRSGSAWAPVPPSRRPQPPSRRGRAAGGEGRPGRAWGRGHSLRCAGLRPGRGHRRAGHAGRRR